MLLARQTPHHIHSSWLLNTESMCTVTGVVGSCHLNQGVLSDMKCLLKMLSSLRKRFPLPVTDTVQCQCIVRSAEKALNTCLRFHQKVADELETQRYEHTWTLMHTITEPVECHPTTSGDHPPHAQDPPHLQVYILVLYHLHIAAHGGLADHYLSQVHLVQDGSLACIVQANLVGRIARGNHFELRMMLMSTCDVVHSGRVQRLFWSMYYALPFEQLSG